MGTLLETGSTRSNFACASGDMSPISSSSKVPWSAMRTRPGLSRSAPEKAPRLYPNSSLSRSVAGIAAQLTA